MAPTNPEIDQWRLPEIEKPKPKKLGNGIIILIVVCGLIIIGGFTKILSSSEDSFEQAAKSTEETTATATSAPTSTYAPETLTITEPTQIAPTPNPTIAAESSNAQCKGEYILIIHLVVDRGQDTMAEANEALSKYIGSTLWEPDTCQSMRKKLHDNVKYVIAINYGHDITKLCDAYRNSQGTPQAMVKAEVTTNPCFPLRES